MRKCILSFSFIISLLVTTHAQVRVAIVAGGHQSSVLEENDLPNWSELKSNYTGRIGFHTGFIADIAFSPKSKLFFQPGVVYYNKGRKFSQRFDPPLGIIINQKSTQFLNYIDVPLNLVLKFGKKTKFIIGGGPYGSFFYSGKETAQTITTGGITESTENNDLSVGNQPGQFRTTDYGINGLAGLEFRGFFITANYSRGLNDFYESTVYNGTFRHEVIGGTLGVFLGKTEKIEKKIKDIDKDGINDDKDHCPEEPGSAATNGCPDKDAAVFQKNDERTTYNMIYSDGKGGLSYAKRFNVTGVTRDKEYDLTKGDEKSKIHYLSVNPNGEAEVVKIVLTPGCAARIKEFDFYFEELAIKGRSSMGNQVTKYPIKSVRFKEAGKATLSGRKLWFDEKFGRLSAEEKGTYLGSFEPDDRILVIYNDGNYEVTDQEMTQKIDPEKVLYIGKFDPEKVITAVYVDNDKKQYMVKRFKIETSTLKTKFMFIKEGDGNYVEAVTTDEEPILAMQQGRGAQIRKAKLKIVKIAEVTGWKTVGTKLADYSKSTEMEWVKSKESNQAELFE